MFVCVCVCARASTCGNGKPCPKSSYWVKLRRSVVLHSKRSDKGAKGKKLKYKEMKEAKLKYPPPCCTVLDALTVRRWYCTAQAPGILQCFARKAHLRSLGDIRGPERLPSGLVQFNSSSRSLLLSYSVSYSPSTTSGRSQGLRLGPCPAMLSPAVSTAIAVCTLCKGARGRGPRTPPALTGADGVIAAAERGRRTRLCIIPWGLFSGPALQQGADHSNKVGVLDKGHAIGVHGAPHFVRELLFGVGRMVPLRHGSITVACRHEPNPFQTETRPPWSGFACSWWRAWAYQPHR